LSVADGAAAAGGYGVPFGNGGYSAGQANYYSQPPQQQQYASANFGYGNQYQTGGYGQVSYGIAPNVIDDVIDIIVVIQLT